MSRIYDNWEKLVGAVLKREEFRRLAHCESFSTSISSDFSSRPSFESDVPHSHDSRNPSETSDQVPSSWKSIFGSRNIKFIQYEEIKLATQNFQPDMLLGEGRFGPIFKGWIHEHLLTAVKPGFGVAVAFKKLYKREIFCLNQYSHHPNLVKLIGYSFEEGNRVLAYEFMANGSLDNHLFTRGHQLLSWETRVKVATGAARGLSFFHDLAMIVRHEGLRSSSILLDDEFNAKLSDLDLTSSPRLTPLSTPVRINDYAAPEYLSSGTGGLTMKSDVYSFGIIPLELLTGLRVFDENRPMKEQNLIVWAKRYLSKKKLLQIVDSRLERQYHRDGAYKFGKLALQCLSLDPKLRPRMAEVIDMLEKLSVGPIELSTGVDTQMDQTGSSIWDVEFQPLNDMISACRISGEKLDPAHLSSQDTAHLSSQHTFFFRNVMAIEYEEMRKATKNFTADLLVGVGGFGSVYKGWIDEHNLTAVKPGSGIVVAIKKMNHQGWQGHKEWVDEIHYLSQLRHPNLVKLIGYSCNKDERIVVYEFMPKGNLTNHLFSRVHQALPWATRTKVAIGAATALAFLHGLETPVIHRGIKSRDILLDGDFNTKLSDFGLARDGPTGDRTHVSTRVVGTYVYAAPEYIATGHLTTRCDVFGFGVVLLEQISGLRVLDANRPRGMRNLIDWARSYLCEKSVSKIVDSRLMGEYPYKEACKVAKIARQCVSENPRLRPRMSEVVAELQKL